MYSVSRPKKMALCCSHGLVAFDLKSRCEVRRLWRRVAVASVDHRYMIGVVNDPSKTTGVAKF